MKGKFRLKAVLANLEFDIVYVQIQKVCILLQEIAFETFFDELLS